MPYQKSNPPGVLSENTDFRLWIYTSEDPPSEVRVDGYFENGYDLGMKKGDVLNLVDNVSTPPTVQIMVVASSSKNNGVNMTDGIPVAGPNTD